MSDRDIAREIVRLCRTNPNAEVDDLASEIATALAKARAEGPGWQPIETAPRNGTRFLTWCKTYGVRVGMAYHRADHDDWLSNLDAYGGSSKGGMRATHWMPLPPPPRALAEGGE